MDRRELSGWFAERIRGVGLIIVFGLGVAAIGYLVSLAVVVVAR